MKLEKSTNEIREKHYISYVYSDFILIFNNR